jgi:hypothetical protein
LRTTGQEDFFVIGECNACGAESVEVVMTSRDFVDGKPSKLNAVHLCKPCFSRFMRFRGEIKAAMFDIAFQFTMGCCDVDFSIGRGEAIHVILAEEE